MANDIDKTSPHYKGEFGSIYEVNQKFPNGGVNGDYVEIDGWAHYWNADRGTWCVNAQRDSYWDELITGIIEKFKLFKGATYMGVAGLDTVPAKAIGAKMYYFATVAGTYKNFGDLAVPQGINVLYSENGSSWVNTTLLEVAQELGVSTKKVVSQKALNDALNLKANQSSVNEALAKKFDKESVAQESGDSDKLVMSQKAVSDKLSDLSDYLAYSAKGEINVESLYVKWLNPDATYPTRFSLRVYYNRLISDKYYNGFAIIAYGEGYPSSGAFVCKNYRITSESTPFETNYINKLVKLTGANCEAYIKVINATTDANRDFIIKNKCFYPNPTYNEYKKFDKESVAQESGDSDKLVMSQKAVSDKLSDLSDYLAYSAKGEINVESLYVKWLNPDATYPTRFSLRVYYNRLISDKYYNGFAIIAYGEGYPSSGAFVCKNYRITSESTPFETNYINKLVKLTGANCEAYIKVINATTDANRDFIIKNKCFYPNPTYNEYYIETKEVSFPANVATIDSLNVVDNKTEQLKNSLDAQSQQILTIENQVTNKLNEFQEIIDSEENKSKFIGVFNSDSELPTEGIKENSYAYANNPRTEWLFKNSRWEDTGIKMPITVLSEENYVEKTVFDTTIQELRFGKENTLAGEYIYISTQEGFGNILTKVKQKVDEYITLDTEDLCTINVLIHGGIYKFSNVQSLVLNSYTKAYNISINISAVPGEKVYAISDGEELTPNDAIALTPTHYICNISDYDTSYGFVDQDFNHVKVQNTGNINPLGINLMEEKPVFDTSLNQIKFKIPKALSILKNKNLEYFKNSYLYFTCQWFDYTAHSIYSDDTYIYATYDTSEENTNAIRENRLDESYELPTRFYITNVLDVNVNDNQVSINNNKIYIPRNISKLYLAKYSNLFKFENLHFSNIALSNINFVGSAYSHNSLIEFMDCNNIYCNYNVFKNINSFNCISVDGSVTPYVPNKGTHTGTQTHYSVNNNVSYNEFIDIGVSVFSGGRISGVEFSHNYIYNTGILRCNKAIILMGKDNHISYNKFINIPFASVYLLGPITYFTVVIEYNEFYNTNDYNNTYIAHSLIDGGVIYSGWHSDNTIIRYNIFHDKRSYANYRGIMVDSGGYNVSIYGNLFYRIQNTFTIDLRQVTATNDREIRDRNTNNFVYDNIIVGTCNLMGNPEHPNEVYLGDNIYCTKYNTNKDNVTTDAQLTGEQVEDSDLFIDNDVVYLTKVPKFSVSPFIKSRLVIGV